MKQLALLLSLLLLVAGTAIANGDWYPPLRSRFKMPDLKIIDEKGQANLLAQKLSLVGTGPIFLLPAFTRCRGTCPVTVHSLIEATRDLDAQYPGKRHYRVMIISFDPQDRPADLARFRETEQVPASWSLVIAENGSSIRDFLDNFSYSVMTSKAGFDHPSEIFIFSEDLIWKGSLFGSTLNGAILDGAYKTASRNPTRRALTSVKSWLENPEWWAIAGGIGFVISILILLFLSRSFKSGG